MGVKTEIVIGNGRELNIDRDIVFRQVKCDKDNPLYDEFKEEYESLLPGVLDALEPKAALGFARYPDDLRGSSIKPGSEVLYLISTVGRKICDMVSDHFKNGDYVKGMLTDAMASAALFSFEKPVFERLRKMCAEKHLGISRRYEAPGHVPMEIQKVAFDALNAHETLGLDISSGYMYDPVKSSCQVFETTENERVLHLAHGCSDCSNTDCPHRVESVLVRIKDPGGDYELSAAVGAELMELLRENGIPVSTVCGGAGRCGKCAVRVIEGSVGISDDDRRLFSENELAQGIRLSCRVKVTENCRIEVMQSTESDMVSLGAEGSENGVNDEFFGIAIDIGTTTLALSLTGLESGGIKDTYTAINRQRSLGADVITRIEAAGKGRDKELKKLICGDLAAGIKKLLEDNGVKEYKLKRISIAGNTTMLHLLMGYPAAGLGVYPFTPVNIDLEQKKAGDIFGEEIPKSLWDVDTVLLPGNSAFVGADIISGLYCCGFHENEKISALIDLGTNGEMAIGNRDRLMVTSTAAGPAFEGGNIKWGVGSIKGAISSVEIEGTSVRVKTIGDTDDITGICGTGVIETTAELLKEELIDETGVLDDDFFDDGFPLAENKKGESIVFTQKDIREIQLAKSAIRAGFETMLKRYGISYGDIDKLYVCGGFGYYLDVKKAAAIGMIPEELLDRCVAAGNTSLKGAVKVLGEGEKAYGAVCGLAKAGEEIALSADKDFNELYMEYMMFGD